MKLKEAVPEAGSWKAFLVIPLFGLIATGCASAQAKAPVDRPAMNVPPPPPRIIEPAEVAPDPVPELPQSPAAPRSTSTRPASTKPPVSEGKPEVKPASEPKPVEPPPVEPSPVAPPAAQLRTPQTADTTGAARAVRTTIDTAQRLLNTVNYGPLSKERKKAYDDAKLFIGQAEDALKQANFVFAQAVATKAETLAKELAGR